MEKNRGKVYIVGAGCGDWDLISVRGLELIKRCQVLVYDDLIAGELLELAPESAQRIYMGKRSGRHSAAQEEINAMLIAKAREGKVVVRLKGGDPFVFGRGGEEILALQQAGIAFEKVPGISSAIAIPAAAGIPVTHRNLSRSVHIVTAHTAGTSDGLPEYFDWLAKLPGTLVFLMGLSRLKDIALRLMWAGMDAGTPAAVISGGNAVCHACVRGCLADIAQRAEAAAVKAPAVIVVGKVATLDLRDRSSMPLSGVTVGLTGTSGVAGKLQSQLRALGARVLRLQRSRVVELASCYDFFALSGSRQLLVFTSQNGVEIFFEHLKQAGVDLRSLSRCRFAVIGPATGKVLASHGISADICPEEYTSAALAREILRRPAEWERISIFRSAKGSPELFEALSAVFPVEDIHLYDVVPFWNSQSVEATPDYLCFTSAGGVRLYFEQYGSIPTGSRCVAIGPVTEKELISRSIKEVIPAAECTVEGVTAAILRDVERSI